MFKFFKRKRGLWHKHFRFWAFCVFITTWCALGVLPVAVDHKPIWTTLMAVPPVPLVAWVLWKEFARKAFDKDLGNDKDINFPGFAITIFSWIVAWSLPYTAVWAWDEHYFYDVPSHNAYNVWGFMISKSCSIYTSNSFGYAEPSVAWLAFLMAMQDLFSVFINIALGAIIIAIVYDRIKSRVAQ